MAQGQDGLDVELRQVTKGYGDVLAVDRVDLRVRKGEFFSLLGPSGCGKTTTLRIIAGFDEADEGAVTLRGELVNDVPPYKRGVGMVFQNLALFPHMNVFQNLAFGLRMQRVPSREIRERVHRMLEVVELPGIETRRVDQLSGGQQQRVALARALIPEPTVLLLDEPLGALDLKLRVQMQTEIKQVHARVGTTFLYVTHDQGEALAMSDRIAVMHQGRIQQVGTPTEIYERPANSFVADFIGETNLLRGLLVDAQRVDVEGLTIRVKGDSDLVGREVFLSLRPEKVRVFGGPPELPNGFQGEVKDLTFRGSRVEVRVRVEESLTLRAEVDPRTAKDLRAGQRAAVGWEPEDVVILLS